MVQIERSDSIPRQRSRVDAAVPHSRKEFDQPAEQIASWLLQHGGHIEEVAAITRLSIASVADLASQPDSSTSPQVENERGKTNAVVEGFARELITAGLIDPKDTINIKLSNPTKSTPGIAARVIDTAYLKVRAITDKEKEQLFEEDEEGKVNKHQSAEEREYHDLSRPFAQATAERMAESGVQTIFKFALFRLADKQAAEDITQDTMVNIVRNVGRNPGIMMDPEGSSGGAWAVTIARNLLLDYVKSAKYRLESATDDMLGSEGHYMWYSPEHGPEEQAVDAETSSIIRSGITELVDNQRAVLELRFLEGMSVEETSEVIGKTLGATKALQHRGANNLRLRLGHSLGFGESSSKSDRVSGQDTDAQTAQESNGDTVESHSATSRNERAGVGNRQVNHVPSLTFRPRSRTLEESEKIRKLAKRRVNTVPAGLRNGSEKAVTVDTPIVEEVVFAPTHADAVVVNNSQDTGNNTGGESRTVDASSQRNHILSINASGGSEAVAAAQGITIAAARRLIGKERKAHNEAILASFTDQ